VLAADAEPEQAGCAALDEGFDAAEALRVGDDADAATHLIGVGVLEGVMLNLQNTIAVNFAGNPALAVPIPMRSAPVPVASLQFIGRPGSEAELLNAGRIVEAAVANQ